MNLIQGMYETVRYCVQVGEGLSDEFEGKVGVHQGSVLSSQLFVVVLGAFSKWMGRFQLFAFTRKWMMHWTKPTIAD